MKSITDGANYLRVSDEVADKKVKTGKFKYISKSEYKKHLEPSTSLTQIEKVETQEKKSEKLERRLKLKENQR